VEREDILLILICGSDRSSQTRDIKEAKRLAKEV
jgi:putative component of toxin-antitoxin plasmid stabilization module